MAHRWCWGGQPTLRLMADVLPRRSSPTSKVTLWPSLRVARAACSTADTRPKTSTPPLSGGSVDEAISPSVLRQDEAKALLGIEPFDSTNGHDVSRSHNMGRLEERIA